MSQAALAEASGLSLRTVTNYEYGKVRDPRLSTLAALAKALDITIDELVAPPAPPAKRARRTSLVR